MRKRWYVGMSNGVRTPFAWAETPTPSTTPEYAAVIGPFVTKRAAVFMAEHGGHDNPHLQHVRDAERIAKYYSEH